MGDPVDDAVRPWWDGEEGATVAALPAAASRPQTSWWLRQWRRVDQERVVTGAALVLVLLIGVLLALAAGAQPTANDRPDLVLTAGFAVAVIVSSLWCPGWLVAAVGAVAFLLPQPGITRFGALLAVGAGIASLFVPWLFQRALVLLGAMLVLQSALRLQVDVALGASSVAAAVITVPVVGAAWFLGPKLWRVALGIAMGLVAACAVIGLASGARVAVDGGGTVTEAEGRTNDALTALRNGDTAQASAGFASLADDLDSVASGLAEGPVRFARWVPVLAQHQAYLERTAQLTAGLARQASTTVRSVDPRSLRVTEGRLDTAQLQAAAAPLAALQSSLQRTRDGLTAPTSVWVASPVKEPVGRLADQLARAQTDAGTAALAARVLPGLLGTPEPRRYAIAFTERPDTGKLVAWAVVTETDGKLSIDGAGRVDDVPGHEALPPFTIDQGPAAGQALATAVQPLVPPGPAFAGTVTMGPDTMVALARLMGPVKVPELDLTVKPEDVLPALTSGDARTRAVVGAALLASLGRSTLPGPEKAGAILSPVVRTGDLRVLLTDPAGKELLRRLNLR